MLHPASNEVGMDLIRHQDHAVLPANLRHADQLIRRPYPAYRIFRGAENENLVSLLRTDLLEPLPIHLIVPYRGLEQMATGHYAAQFMNHAGKIAVYRMAQNHAVSRFGESPDHLLHKSEAKRS